MYKKECLKIVAGVLFTLAFYFGLELLANADSPAKQALSDINWSNYTSSQVVAKQNGYQNLQLSTGVIRFDGVFIDSVGTNSQLLIYESNVSSGGIGNSTRVISGLEGRGTATNTYGFADFRTVTSTEGLVFTSTCAICTTPWVPPAFRFIYQRQR